MKKIIIQYYKIKRVTEIKKFQRLPNIKMKTTKALSFTISISNLDRAYSLKNIDLWKKKKKKEKKNREQVEEDWEAIRNKAHPRKSM